MSKLKTFNAVLMVTGTSVGTGVLGLPIATSAAGLIPTLGAFIVAWIFMTLAALHILDIKMQVRGNYNLSSMIRLTLGKPSQIFSAITIIGLLYALLCTYMMAGSAWFRVLISSYIKLTDISIILVFTSIFAVILYAGEKFIYNINNFLAICLIIAFSVTIGVSVIPNNYEFISYANYSAILPSLPVLLTTFGFSIIVPAVTEYLEFDRKAVRTSVLWGGLIALFAYTVWEWVTLGNIPLFGKESLQSLREMGDNGTGVILTFAKVTNNSTVNIMGRVFAIFAAVTSFMGVSVALIHFLADNLKIKASGSQRLYLLLLIYIPPILITSFIPNAFVQVLSFAGIFVAILLGLFPVLMVYNSHRAASISISNIKKNFFLMVSAVFFIMVIIQELCNIIR